MKTITDKQLTKLVRKHFRINWYTVEAAEPTFAREGKLEYQVHTEVPEHQADALKRLRYQRHNYITNGLLNQLCAWMVIEPGRYRVIGE